MKTKIIPFNIETAKDIQNGKIKGKIVRNGREVTILDYNSKQYKYLGYPIRFAYLDEDEIDYAAPEGLHIEVLDNDPQFKPFDHVLVRRPNLVDPHDIYGQNEWVPALFQGMSDGYFIAEHKEWEECIPYKGNEHLVGTTDKPNEE